MTKKINYDAAQKATIDTYDRTAQQWAGEMGGKSDWDWAASELRDLTGGGSVLEIGCGGGRDARELIDKGFMYTGTDLSSGMIQVAQEAVPGANFQKLSVYNLVELDEKFDAFWAAAVLLHVPEERLGEALDQIRQVAVDGAIGFIVMKDGEGEDLEVRESNGMQQERLFTYYTKEGFSSKLDSSGFEVLSYRYKPFNDRTNYHAFFVKKRKES